MQASAGFVSVATDCSVSTPERYMWVPAGGFMMGSPSDEPGGHDDEILHSVTLTHKHFMKQTEVTQGEWMSATDGTNPSAFAGCGGNCPVEQVDWLSSAASAKWLSVNDRDAATSPCYTFSQAFRHGGQRPGVGLGGYPGAVIDPRGRPSDSGSYRVSCGGCWYSAAEGVRAAVRFCYFPGLRYN